MSKDAASEREALAASTKPALGYSPEISAVMREVVAAATGGDDDDDDELEKRFPDVHDGYAQAYLAP
jgi:hypothetical protein